MQVWKGQCFRKIIGLEVYTMSLTLLPLVTKATPDCQQLLGQSHLATAQDWGMFQGQATAYCLRRPLPTLEAWVLASTKTECFWTSLEFSESTMPFFNPSFRCFLSNICCSSWSPNWCGGVGEQQSTGGRDGGPAFNKLGESHLQSSGECASGSFSAPFIDHANATQTLGENVLSSEGHTTVVKICGLLQPAIASRQCALRAGLYEHMWKEHYISITDEKLLADIRDALCDLSSDKPVSDEYVYYFTVDVIDAVTKVIIK